MNREANTLGSKAGSMEVTRAAMDLKLLIEQKMCIRDSHGPV